MRWYSRKLSHPLLLLSVEHGLFDHFLPLIVEYLVDEFEFWDAFLIVERDSNSVFNRLLKVITDDNAVAKDLARVLLISDGLYELQIESRSFKRGNQRSALQITTATIHFN